MQRYDPIFYVNFMIYIIIALRYLELIVDLIEELIEKNSSIMYVFL